MAAADPAWQAFELHIRRAMQDVQRFEQLKRDEAAGSGSSAEQSSLDAEDDDDDGSSANAAYSAILARAERFVPRAPHTSDSEATTNGYHPRHSRPAPPAERGREAADERRHVPLPAEAHAIHHKLIEQLLRLQEFRSEDAARPPVAPRSQRAQYNPVRRDSRADGTSTCSCSCSECVTADDDTESCACSACMEDQDDPTDGSEQYDDEPQPGPPYRRALVVHPHRAPSRASAGSSADALRVYPARSFIKSSVPGRAGCAAVRKSDVPARHQAFAAGWERDAKANARARNEAAREVKHFMLRAHASPPVRGATDRVLARREHELRTQNLTLGNGATHYKKRRDGIHWRVRCFMNS
ncbi:hypothetical protein DIPPA_27014 [Diplonema papillatum]|nr:hypothetical protein DIPPA_27014 [Diplonema papillatum]